MLAKSVLLEKSARKNLTKLPLNVHQRIINALNVIKGNPVIGIKLHGELSGYYKLRVGDYRIIYSFNIKNSVVIVVKIEHRQGVYK